MDISDRILFHKGADAMHPFLWCQHSHITNLPSVVEIPLTLDQALKELLSHSAPNKSRLYAVEVGAVVCYDGTDFYLMNQTEGQPTSVDVSRYGVSEAVGGYHSHPGGSTTDPQDIYMMFERRKESFALIDGTAGMRYALLKTSESPTMLTLGMKQALIADTLNLYTGAMGKETRENQLHRIAHAGMLGYYKGHGTNLLRVYPTDQEMVKLKEFVGRLSGR